MEKKRVFGTGGELLVHQLVAQGVRYVFTNTGSAEAGFFNALLTVPGVQPILLLAESLVLSAADGYAKAAQAGLRQRAPGRWHAPGLGAAPERLF